jgi:hypothetical protein
MAINTPVPVPKESLFKVKGTATPGGKTHFAVAAAMAKDESPAMMAAAVQPKAKKVKAPVSTPGVPLLKATVFETVIPTDLYAKITKPLKSTAGGWQHLMMDLQAATSTNDVELVHTVKVTPHLLDNMLKKATSYGEGGYQNVIRHLIALVLNQHRAKVLGGGE